MAQASVNKDENMITTTVLTNREGLKKRSEKLKAMMSTWIRDGSLEVPTMPKTVTQAMALANDPQTTVDELEKLIETDQAVAGRLIQIANSPMLRRARDVESIKDAIIRVGQEELKQTLFSVFVETRLFASKEYALLIKALWRHSLAVSALAKNMAAYIKGEVDPETAFLAGLIHDSGKAALISNIPQEMMGREVLPEFMIERVIQSLHELAGGIIAKNWNMTDDVIQAVLRHHNPLAGDNPSKLAMMLYVADVMYFKLKLDGIEPTENEDDLLLDYRPLYARRHAMLKVDIEDNPVFKQLGINKRILELIEDDAEVIKTEMKNAFVSSTVTRKAKESQVLNLQDGGVRSALKIPPKPEGGSVKLAAAVIGAGAFLAAAGYLGYSYFSG